MFKMSLKEVSSTTFPGLMYLAANEKLFLVTYSKDLQKNEISDSKQFLFNYKYCANSCQVQIYLLRIKQNFRNSNKDGYFEKRTVLIFYGVQYVLADKLFGSKKRKKYCVLMLDSGEYLILFLQVFLLQL